MQESTYLIGWVMEVFGVVRKLPVVVECGFTEVGTGSGLVDPRVGGRESVVDI